MKTLKEFRRTAVEMTREVYAQVYGHDVREFGTHKLLVYCLGYLECYSDGTYGMAIHNKCWDSLTRKQAEEILWDEFSKHELGLTSSEQFDDLIPRVEKFLTKTVGDFRDLPQIERLDTAMQEYKNQIGSPIYSKAAYFSSQLSYALQLEEQYAEMEKKKETPVMDHKTFVGFLKSAFEEAVKNPGDSDTDKENFVFFYLLYVKGYDVEKDEKASQYLLKATPSEMYKYVLEVILPKIGM